MSRRYHYDSKGKLKGWSSNQPPNPEHSPVQPVLVICIIVMLLAFFGGC